AVQKQQAVDHAVALRSQFRKLNEPVVFVHGLVELASVVCAERPLDGFDLFKEALSGLRLVKLNDFTSARHRLPVPSFTALWNVVKPAALKCSPELRTIAVHGPGRRKHQNG